jgi:RecA-family ATPase
MQPKPVDSSKLLRTWEHPEPGPQEWVIDQWLPKGYVTSLFAHPGASKSFLAQYFGMCIATGKDVFGRAVQRGPVLFLDGELNLESWLRRGYMLARGSMNSEEIPDDLFYYQVEGSVLEPSIMAEVLGFIADNGIVLTVIDSFTACLPGDDTNKLDDVAVRLRKLRPLGSVLVIDHAAKAADMTVSGTAIGSNAKTMFVRSALQIASSPAGGSILQHVKTNFGKRSDPVAYKIEFSGAFATVRQVGYDDESLEGIEGAVTAAKRIIAAFRANCFPQGATVRDVAEALDLVQRTVRNNLNSMRRRKHLHHEGKRYYLPPAAPVLAFDSSKKDSQTP